MKLDIEQAGKDAQQEFNNTIKSWHEDYELNQRKLESKFNIDDVAFWSVNVWDEMNHQDSTFVYVEMNEIPDKVCFTLLNHIWHYLQLSDLSGLSVRFYDSTNIYPSNLLTEAGRYTSFKRWELLLENVTSYSLDSIVELLKKVPDFNGKKINVYSES